MPSNGLFVMTPTSIASTGTGNSSSINADGSVDFASCETLSLNGVFTSSYDNYMIVIRIVASVGAQLHMRLRASGTDTSSSDYTSQQIQANSTTVSANRLTAAQWRPGYIDSVRRAGLSMYLFGPKLSSPTAYRSVSAHNESNAFITDDAGTLSLTTSYDGVTFISATGGRSFSGLLTVFGFNQ